MRIGIDARTLSGRFTGDRTYWRGLIAGLAAVDQTNEYVLYTRLPIEGEPPAVGPFFRWRQIPQPSNDALWMLTAFPRACAEDKIDIAHTQYNIPLLGAPCPVVTTVHDVSFALFPELFLPRDRWILNTLVPRSMRRAAHVIAVSENTHRDILRCYGQWVSPEKVSTILEAADSRFMPPGEGQESTRVAVNTRLGLTDAPYLLSVGVLQPRKNLGLLLQAFTALKERPDAPLHRLFIVGKRGWLGDDLDRTVAALPSPIARDIVWTGYVADEDLPGLYGGADAFCYPSRYEGFGLPPLEAMACGCPVLCADASSLPEVVGQAAILLPPDDIEAWTEALYTMLMQPAERERLRAMGLERARRFSWEQTARETLRVYESVRQKT